MNVQRITHEEAFAQLALVEPRACSAMPQFIATPTPIAETNRRGIIDIAFECIDSANDRHVVVQVTFGPPLRDAEAVSRRLIECAVEANEKADRATKAVFN